MAKGEFIMFKYIDLLMKYTWLKIEHTNLLEKIKEQVFEDIISYSDQDDVIALKEAEIKKLRKQIRYYKNKLKEKE